MDALQSCEFGEPTKIKSSTQWKMWSTPCWRMIHSMASATAEKMRGAERRPNGRTLSRYSWSFHCIASSSLSKGWTGIMRKASFMSAFASRNPLPKVNYCFGYIINGDVGQGAEILSNGVINTVGLRS